MLQYYEWSTNPPPVILSGGDLQQSPLFNDQTTTFTDQNHQFFHHHHHHHQPPSYNTPSFYDQQQQQQSRPFFDPTQLLPSSMDHHQHQQPSSFFLVPKPEEAVEITARLGLNLGGRTYFSNSTEEYDFVNRLYRRSNRGHEANVPRCQAEDCNADLTHAKHYHRRHKVCEFHSKAATVVAAGLTQRFCQQCSRFHLLSEFDNGKRSCRKRLADHNRRRRKSNQQTNNNTQDQFSALKSHEEPAARISSSADQNITRESPPDSGAQPSSSVTVAASPPRMFLDCFKQKAPYEASLHASSNSLF